ncbi:MAG TPA: DUF6116 family protein [Thermoanaerobaculia bacterium]|nr:DUF6116 family protein [Thermoanaerobaculia bacterium]
MASEPHPEKRSSVFPFSMLERLRFPQLFLLLFALLVADLIVPDPLPFLDEMVLGILTLLVGSWRHRERAPRESLDKEPTKNVTPER